MPSEFPVEKPARRRLRIVAVAALLAVAVPALAAPHIAPWGFDVAGMDRTVKPGDDFDRHASGTWMRDTPIPPDRTSWGPFFALRAAAEADVKAIVDDVVGRPHPAGSVERKITDFYNSYVDMASIEAAGLAPVSADLSSIAAVRSHEDVARLMGRPELRVGGPLSISTWPDAANPDRYAVNIVQSGLTLPDRDYYLGDDARFVDTRHKLRAYVQAMLALGRYPEPAKSADAVLALETAIARLHWTREKRGNKDLTYHPKSRAALAAFAPDYPWGTALDALALSKHDLFVVKEDEAILALSRLFRTTPVATWRAYLTFHFLDASADLLPSAFNDLAFDFNGRTLTGQPHQRERWKRATTALNAALGEALGRLYVDRHFTPAAKAGITELVGNLRSALGWRIVGLPWMSVQTKAEALRKLAMLRVKVGYPENWRDYSTLEIRAGDPIGNRQRALLWDWRRRVERLGRPTDRDEWGMTPQTVNAYYNGFFNEIVFPAAILQPPYFDPDADAAVNYGGIGGVIGHEMVHAFDDQGSKTDGRGAQRNWWSDADRAHFTALGARLAAQYSRCERLPGVFVDGRATLGENIGDNGGLNVAYEAWRASLRGSPAPVLDGYSGDQRFFLSWAQTYRENIREPQLRANLAADPHSPANLRVNGVVRNMDAWYAAFGVGPGDALYLEPADRVRVW